MVDLEAGRDAVRPTVPGNASGEPPADAAPAPETPERAEAGDWDRAWLPGWVTPVVADAGDEAVPGGTRPEPEPEPAPAVAEEDLPADAREDLAPVDEVVLPRVVVGPRVKPRRRAGLALGIGLLAAGGIAGAAVLATSSPGAVAAARHSADAEISVPTRAGSTPRSTGIGDAAWAAAPTGVPSPLPPTPAPEVPAPDHAPAETVPSVAAAPPAEPPPPGDVLPVPVTVPVDVPAPDAVAVQAPTALPTAVPTAPPTATPVTTGTPTPTATPVPTGTPTPTATPEPTGTPTPTGTDDPTDPTDDPGQDPQPTPTETPPPTSVAPPDPTDGEDPAPPPPAAARPGPRA